MPSPIPPAVSSVVALSERELGLFFPGNSQERLQALLPGALFFDPLSAKGIWREVLRDVHPEILVSGWRTPAIPAGDISIKYVSHIAGSVRHILTRDMIERGLKVTNWGTVMAEVVSEATLAMILATLRRTQYFGELMHQRLGWEDAPADSLSLFDRKVGIFGFGAIVRDLVPLLRPFRNEIRVHSKGVPADHYSELGVAYASNLGELFAWADVLIVAEALTPETKGVVNADLLRQLRAGAVFVNVARGALVDEAALAEVARERSLRVALDVYQVEPLPAKSPLRGQPNITLMPHVAGVTADRIATCGELALRNIQNYLSGVPLSNIVTLAVYDRST